MSIAKACQKDDIPTKVIKWINNIFDGFIAKDFNSCVDKGVFQDELKKHADVTPVHKKKDKSDKTITSPSVYLQIFNKYFKINL